jgi:hypothetical protein
MAESVGWPGATPTTVPGTSATTARPGLVGEGWPRIASALTSGRGASELGPEPGVERPILGRFSRRCTGHTSCSGSGCARTAGAGVSAPPSIPPRAAVSASARAIPDPAARPSTRGCSAASASPALGKGTDPGGCSPAGNLSPSFTRATRSGATDTVSSAPPAGRLLGAAPSISATAAGAASTSLCPLLTANSEGSSGRWVLLPPSSAGVAATDGPGTRPGRWATAASGDPPAVPSPASVRAWSGEAARGDCPSGWAGLAGLGVLRGPSPILCTAVGPRVARRLSGGGAGPGCGWRSYCFDPVVSPPAAGAIS